MEDSADAITGSSATASVFTPDQGTSSRSSATDSAVDVLTSPDKPNTLSSLVFSSSYDLNWSGAIIEDKGFSVVYISFS